MSLRDDRPLPPARHPVADPDVSAVVDAWCDEDEAHGVLPADREVIAATRSLRALVVASLAADPAVDDRDLLHAFGALGRMMAEGRASPTLAASTVDALLRSGGGHLGSAELDGARYAMAARAAVVESYLHARLALVQAEAMSAWEYPACAVSLGEQRVAVAAGYPEGDDGLVDWASRVAQGVALSGARKVVTSGSDRAIDALEVACGIAGIDLEARPVAAVAKARSPRVR
jgi:hypothetical protein